MENTGYSLSDIAALMGNRNNDGFLEGNGIIILILFFLIFGFGGFGGGWGSGNNAALQGALTRAELYDGLNDNTVIRKLDGITNGLCDGFYAQNTTMLQGFNGLGNQISENRFASQQCCCETNRNIDSVRYENSRNTCDIITAANANTQKILDTLCENKIESLRDKIAERDLMLQSAQYQLSQLSQTATLINTLQPTPKPAYLTCNPYQSSAYAYDGFRGNWNGYGCGCNNGF